MGTYSNKDLFVDSRSNLMKQHLLNKASTQQPCSGEWGKESPTVNTNRREERVWGWEKHREWTGAGKKSKCHRHRPEHEGRDNQSASCLLQSVSNEQAHNQTSVNAMSHIRLSYCGQSPYGRGSLKPGRTLSALTLQVSFSCFSKYPVISIVSRIKWPMVKTLPSYEMFNPFLLQQKEYWEWAWVKRTQYSE